MKLILSAIFISFLCVGRAQSPLDDFIIDEMESKHISGLSAVLIKEGKLAWSGNYGIANWDTGDSVNENTIFMLASVSKTITATALMQLYENGSFALDDDINAYLPFTVHNPNYPDSSITFRHLLTHTSSIADNWALLPYYEGDAPVALGDFLFDYLDEDGADYNPVLNYYSYAPESGYNYSNVAVALCGYLVETISTIPFNEYCNQNIFEPICMDNTAWFLRELDTTLIAHPYTYSGGMYVDEGLYGYPDYPDGQLRTTSISLAKFLWMNMNFGNFDGVRILDSITVELMRSPQFPDLDPTQGLVWYNFTDNNGAWWGHNGGDAGVSTDMWLNEATQTGLLMLTNSAENYGEIWYAILEAADTMNIENAPVIACSIEEPVAVLKPDNIPVKIFPNPTTDCIFFQADQADIRNLKIYSPDGKTIMEIHHLSTGSVNLAHLENSLYFVQFELENQVHISLILKI